MSRAPAGEHKMATPMNVLGSKRRGHGRFRAIAIVTLFPPGQQFLTMPSELMINPPIFKLHRPGAPHAGPFFLGINENLTSSASSPNLIACVHRSPSPSAPPCAWQGDRAFVPVTPRFTPCRASTTIRIRRSCLDYATAGCQHAPAELDMSARSRRIARG